MNRSIGERWNHWTLTHWQLSLRQLLRVGSVVTGACVVCVALCVHLSRSAERELRVQVASAATERLELLRSSTQQSLEALQAIAAYLEVTREPSRFGFRTFVSGPLRRLPEVQAFEWIPRVDAEDRAAFEHAAWRDGYSGFRFNELGTDGKTRPAASRDEYFPVYFVEPTERNLPALGLDLGSHPARRAALEQARKSGKAVASTPIRLAQETQDGELGLLVFTPVYAPGASERQDGLRGFVLAVFRVRDFVQPALASASASGLDVRIVDAASGATLFSGAPSTDAGARTDALAHRAHLTLAGRRWNVVFTPTAAFSRARSSFAPFAYSGAAFLIVLALAGLVIGDMRHTVEIERREESVRERTIELARANSRLEAEIGVRARAEEEAAAARLAQSQFLAAMSHEIRTPLNAIIGYSQILQHHSGDQALQREALHTIVQSGHHLLTLVDEVIDLSKIESGHQELRVADFNLGALISGLSALFRNKCDKKRLALKIEGLGNSPWWVRGDEGKLRQVLINLLGNAVKFTEHGEVRLRVIPEEERAFRFEVIDTGVGIAQAQQERVFGDFYQADPSRASEGAGLGLAISRRLVELMGGALRVRSTPGWGSNFYFSLQLDSPLTVVESEARANEPRLRLTPESHCRALVVDDLEVNREILRHMLLTVGCEVATAPSGRAALDSVESFAPNLVFLDVLMPDMDGLEVARLIRERWGDGAPKLVAFSASALETQRASYLGAGFDDFVAKPFRMERINDCLAKLLHAKFVARDALRDAVDTPAHKPDLGELVVPAAVVEAIREAAELYQITRLRLALARLCALGSAEEKLGEYLRGRAAVYDMDAILELTRELSARGERAA